MDEILQNNSYMQRSTDTVLPDGGEIVQHAFNSKEGNDSKIIPSHLNAKWEFESATANISL